MDQSKPPFSPGRSALTGGLWINFKGTDLIFTLFKYPSTFILDVCVLIFLRFVLEESSSLEPSSALTAFYRGTRVTIMTYCIASWYGNIRAEKMHNLERIVQRAQKIIGAPLLCLHEFYTQSCLRRGTATDSFHPAYSLFFLLPSGRRYRSIASRTSCLKYSFFRSVIRLLNHSMGSGRTIFWTDVWWFGFYASIETTIKSVLSVESWKSMPEGRILPPGPMLPVTMSSSELLLPELLNDSFPVVEIHMTVNSLIVNTSSTVYVMPPQSFISFIGF